MKLSRGKFLTKAMRTLLLIGLFLYNTAYAVDCDEWVAQIVSVQGEVHAKKTGTTQWTPAKLNDIFCPGDMLRVGRRSRAAVILINETVMRLDQNTIVTFKGVEEKKVPLIDIIKGAANFFSRVPRSLKFSTPFVNGAVEGTEFFVEVGDDRTLISVFQGCVAAANDVGSIRLANGRSAIARAEKAPVSHVVVNPRDAVQWAVYYPAVIDYKAADFEGGEGTWQGKVRKSIRFYREGDLVNAFSSLDGVSENVIDGRFYTFRAGLLLTVGRIDEADADIDKAFSLDPNNSDALALQSLIAVTQNKKEEALHLADKAARQDPCSSAARVALSYAQQAAFNVQGALKSLQEAVEISPEDALARARLSELWMSVGDLKKSLEAARQAAALNPNLARTQTVLGFAYLAQVKVKDAKAAFEKAVMLDQAAPLPRLGLGLAKIREGDSKPGRGEIEIAAGLDPNNSIIRSYLGKAFFDEKREKNAGHQFATAKELDPRDPTPWFYDAIRMQTLNRPIEALHDIRKSIELNDNRAVYRSRLLLDEDLAARSANLGRIYNDLGFEQLALVEGWKSVNTDPSSYSAHRFLADSYAAQPRHEIARVSELLQSQLLQPININPVQPHLAESGPFILEGAGPEGPSFNEFNPLFNRDRLALQGSGIVGGNKTYGDEIVHSAVLGRLSYSLGRFHYETAGFRENNDQKQDIYNVFTKVSLSHKTSIQAEYRYSNVEKGDLPLRFDPLDYFDTRRIEEIKRSLRLGFRHAFSPYSDLIGTIAYGRLDDDQALQEQIPLPPPPFGPGTVNMQLDIDSRLDGYTAEIQYLFRLKRFNWVSGIGYADINEDSKIVQKFQPQFSPDLVDNVEKSHSRIEQSNLYFYSLFDYPENVTWTIGSSADFYDGEKMSRDEFNPKVGVTWKPFPDTTLRGAVFRTLYRRLHLKQTIEPTQVAGFNQFFDYPGGTRSWRYGAGVDQNFSKNIYGGVEFSGSEIDIPYAASGQIRGSDWKEQLGRAYLYWTPHQWLALSAEYQFERFDRTPEFSGEDDLVEIKTHRWPLGINFFHPLGFSSRLKITYIDQDGEFGNSLTGVVPGDDRFWVVDASIGYRLPGRWGLVTLEARNLFGEEFMFQDTDPANPRIYPERLIFGKFTVAF